MLTRPKRETSPPGPLPPDSPREDWSRTPLLPVAIYLLAFVVVDTLLSLTFLAWPLLGVNYLRNVDERVWRLNFSPPAKLLNSAVFLLLLLAGQPYAAATPPPVRSCSRAFRSCAW